MTDAWTKTILMLMVLSWAFRGGDSMATESSEDPQEQTIETIVQDYCSIVTDKASEERQARLVQSLEALEERIDEKLKELEAAKTSLEDVITRRDDLRNLAKQEVVSIYAGMEPAVAANQLEKVDAYLASSIIRQLKPRQASAILDESKPELAARLIRILASSSTNSGDSQ
jgi:flagellar motility protein MotE (MotC chaperone)